MVGLLDDKDTRNALWVTGKIAYTNFSVSYPDNKNIEYTILNSKSEILPHYMNGKASFDVNIKTQVDLYKEITNQIFLVLGKNFIENTK